MQELTELEIKVTNFLMKFGILPDRSNFKYTKELIDLIKNHEPKQCAINGVSNCTLCNVEINYKGLCEMCYTEQKLNDLD